MTTIDSYDNEWYRKHARDVRDLEETYKHYFRVSTLDEARTVEPHTWIESLENQIPMVDLLTGVYSPERKTIAFFTRPFRNQRKSPFGFFLLAPSLGSYEKQVSDAERIKSFSLIQDEEEEEGEGREDEEKSGRQGKKGLNKRRKTAIEKMYDMLGSMNAWLLEIKGKQSQYQKG